MKPPEEVAREIIRKYHEQTDGLPIGFAETLVDIITAALTAERQEAEKWKSLVLDYCEEDGRIKTLVRPILTPLEVDGDSYGVPGSLDIVETLLKRLKDAEEAMRTMVKNVEQPELKGASTLVLYFPNDADREEFIGAFVEAKPNCKTIKI